MLTTEPPAMGVLSEKRNNTFDHYRENNEGIKENKNSGQSDDVEALLKGARIILENASLVGSTLFGGSDFTCDVVVGVEKQSYQGLYKEQWQRLLYLEWLLRFVTEKEHVYRELQQKTGSLQLLPICGTRSREPHHFALTSFQKGDIEEGKSAASSDSMNKTSLSFIRIDETSGLSGFAALLPDLDRAPISTSSVTRDGEETAGMAKPETGVRGNVLYVTDKAELMTSKKEEYVLQWKEQELDAKWRCFRTWYPSQISVLTNVQQPYGSETCPLRHILSLSTVVHMKPRGIKAKNEALLAQGRYCKSCLCPLRKQHFPVFSWKEARFCYYTGMYYCTTCHSGRTSVIPARVLHAWDFEPRPVCNDVIDFLELQRERPLYCVSAVNPDLYERVVLLQMMRFLRLQLNALREVGIRCPVFRRLFYREDATVGKHMRNDRSKTVSSNTLSCADYEFNMECFVPRGKRYLMEDSEIWSFSDLEEIHCSQLDVVNRDVLSASTVQIMAYSHTAVTLNGMCGLMTYLKRLRAQMIRHILQKQCDICLLNSLDVCHWCCPTDILLRFRQNQQQQQKRVSQQRQEQEGEFTTTSSCLNSSLRVSLDTCLPEGEPMCLFNVYNFDLLHVRSCTKCGACYHKNCFEEMRYKLVGSAWCLRCQNKENRENNNDGNDDL